MLLTTSCAVADPALTRACVLHATGKQQRATPSPKKNPGRIVPRSPPVVPPAPPDFERTQDCQETVEYQARSQAAARVSLAQPPGSAFVRAVSFVPYLTKGANHLLLQIQRAFRVREQRRRAVQMVAATWPPPQPPQFGIVASLVAGVSRTRTKSQFRVMRRALTQLRQYSLSRAARRRELHIRWCVTTIPPHARGAAGGKHPSASAYPLCVTLRALPCAAAG